MRVTDRKLTQKEKDRHIVECLYDGYSEDLFVTLTDYQSMRVQRSAFVSPDVKSVILTYKQKHTDLASLYARQSFRTLDGVEVPFVDVNGKADEAMFFAEAAAGKWVRNLTLRSPKDWRYLETRDLFHDTFGHMPFLTTNSQALPVLRLLGRWYSAFDHLPLTGDENAAMAERVRRWKKAITKVYWAIFEFGLMSSDDGTPQIIGAGILSSPDELDYVTRSIKDQWENIRVVDWEEVIDTRFYSRGFQPVYFVLNHIGWVRDMQVALMEYAGYMLLPNVEKTLVVSINEKRS